MAGGASFGSQGQQLVFPLYGSANDGSSITDSKESSPGKTRSRTGSGASNGRFEVLTFHQFEKPDGKKKVLAKGDSKSPMEISDGKNAEPYSNGSLMPQSTDASKRISIVKEEEETNDNIKKSIDSSTTLSMSTGKTTLSSTTTLDDITDVRLDALQYDMMFKDDHAFFFDEDNFHVSSRMTNTGRPPLPNALDDDDDVFHNGFLTDMVEDTSNPFAHSTS